MKQRPTDYAVVGHSLAGVSAALTLAETGGHVVLFDFHRDTDALSDLPRVQRTALGPSMSGPEFEEKVRGLLTHAAVERETTCHLASVYSNRLATIECGDQKRRFKGIVFAPNGTEPGLDIEGSTALHGFGVSYSAGADAPFYTSRRVAVWGDAPRVIEHAWIAAQYASKVFILTKQSTNETQVDLLNDLRSSSTVTFDESIRLLSLHTSADGTLSGISVETPNGRRSIEVAALFVAQHLMAMTNVLHEKSPTDDIVLAGLAAGIPYWKHNQLVDDGARAARLLLAVHQ